ncbi:acyltransferase [Larkinella terrae]
MIRNLANGIGITNAIFDSFHPISKTMLRGILYKAYLKKCGWATSIDKYVTILGADAVEIGSYCGVNSFVHIWGHNGVSIGDRVMIASHVAITSLTHDYTAASMRFSTPLGDKIFIQDDVWIGSHAVIMPGVSIGKGAVIGAGSVVTKNIPAYAVAIGTPARIVKYRPFPIKDNTPVTV